MTSNAAHTRIGDHKISFGMVRYSDGKTDTYHKEHAFWRCVISNNTGSEKLAAFDASTDDLDQIKRWCDEAKEILRTDGGRLAEDVAEAAQ